MLNLIITPWFRILTTERDGAAELRLTAAAESRRERERPRGSFDQARQDREKPVLAVTSRAC